MTRPTESGTPQTQTWSEKFSAQHPVEGLPKEMQAPFTDLLAHREAISDYYIGIPEERFGEGIGQGDSPQFELAHQIVNTSLRANALKEGSLSSWSNPEQLELYQKMSRDILLDKLDQSTVSLYDAVVASNPHGKVNLPFGKTSSSVDFLWGAVRHDVLHLGMAIKFGDYFGVPRPSSVRILYG